MTCSDVERVLPELLDGAPEGAFPTDFETHLKSCPACSELVSDLKLIASEARQLAATEEPAPRVWARIAAELRAEGLIREPETMPKFAPTRPILAPASPRRRWSAWWLAPVAAALLAAGSFVVSHKPAPQVAKQAPAPPVTSPASSPVPDETPAVTSASVPTPAPQQLAQKSAKSTDRVGTAAGPAVEPEPSQEDQQFLSVVSTRAPSMRATYESQLRAVNADIRETQAYVDRNPGDADARQHLMDAYQQKALLYQIALDRIQ
ncbi:MAG TPA: zf-HC2 domain-containing protein [Terriglobales bacterium]|nr:zf-HC2 domain-containing protein [Terriglobales bacterium]